MLALGLRSYFSLADGYLSPAKAIAAAKAAGADVVAFADRGELAGYFEFFAAAKEQGVKVVPGIEIALDDEGDRRPGLVFGVGPHAEEALWAFVAGAAPASEETFGLPCAALSELNPNLALFSGIPDSHIESLLWAHDEQGIQAFLNRAMVNNGRVALAIPPQSIDPQAQGILSRVRTQNKSLRILPYEPLVYADGSLEGFRACRAMVFGLTGDESLDEGGRIRTVEDIGHGNAVFDPRHFTLLDRYGMDATKERPGQSVYRGQSPEQCQAELETICRSQFARFIEHVERHERGSFDDARRAQYETRLTTELAAVARCGFAPSLLMAVDTATAVENAGMRVRARGSSVNSLIAYLTTISSINPVFEALPFERFLNPDRVKEPDVDLDIQASTATRARDVVLETIPGAVLLRQFTPATVLDGMDAALRHADPRRRDFVKTDLADALDCRIDDLRSSTLEELRAKFPDFDKTFIGLRVREEFKMEEALRSLEHCDGRPVRSTFHVGIGYSPGGELAHVPMLPVVTPGGRSALMAAVDYQTAHRHGLMKIDAIPCNDIDLALTINQTLTELGHTSFAATIPDLSREHFVSIFHEGRVATIPHYHNHASLLMRAKPTTFEEVVDINALIRITGKPEIVDRYVTGGGEKLLTQQLAGAPSKLISDVLDIARPTRHVILYDEQIIQAFSAVGGISRAQADIMRSEIKSGDGLAQGSRDLLRAGIIEQYKCDPQIADQTIAVLSSGGGYLFPRGHALSYAAAAANLAVAKRDFPTEYMLSYIRHFRSENAPVTNKAFRQNLGALCWELSSLGFRVDMGAGETLKADTVTTGDLVPGATPNTASRDTIVLGLDVFPQVSANDLEAVRNGEEPSKACRALIEALNKDTDAARQAFYDGLGFLPNNLHPGFCAKRRLPSNLLRRPPEGRDAMPLACFVKKAMPPRESQAGWTVRAELTSHLGDKVMHAGRFFSAGPTAETDARRFYDALAALSPYESIELHVTYKPKENGGGWWNITTPTPRACPPDAIEMCSAMVDRARAATTRRPTDQTKTLAA